VLDDQTLQDLANELVRVAGVVGVVLGGSRARGEHTPQSDVDLGLYYRQPLDLPHLRSLAQQVAGPTAQLTDRGGWGQWVDGGGWLRIDDTAVDWIYRDLDRVHACWADASAGRYAFHMQVGHPLGVPDFSYPGELALAAVLTDPSSELTDLQQRTRDYPPELGKALVRGLWEADFALQVAKKAVNRGDTAYVAGCLFHAVLLCAHALHGHAGRWLINEKGAVAAAGRLPGAPPRFSERAQDVLGRLGRQPHELSRAIDVASELLKETTDACR
jgi:Nucleotidyltransferase domain